MHNLAVDPQYVNREHSFFRAYTTLHQLTREVNTWRSQNLLGEIEVGG